jgi:DNA-binding NtrC family response regulator
MDKQQKCILLVEDDDWLLFVLRESLERIESKHQLVTAHRASEALEKSEVYEPILLITDIRLPGMNGVQLTEKLLQKHENMVAIWITAYGCYRVRQEMQALDVHRCVNKPLKIGKFRDITCKALTLVTNGADH